MDLIAKLPCIAAKIYRNLYREGSSIGAIDSNLDWSHNFTNMLGYSDAQFTELMRLYLTIHRWEIKCLHASETWFLFVRFQTNNGNFYGASSECGILKLVAVISFFNYWY